MISAIHTFRENISEISRNVSDTTPRLKEDGHVIADSYIAPKSRFCVRSHKNLQVDIDIQYLFGTVNFAS